MNRKFTALGLSILLLGTSCVVALMLTGITGWLFFDKSEKRKPVRIQMASVAPLDSPTVLDTQPVVNSSAGLEAAPMKQSAPAEPSPTAISSPTPLPSPTPIPGPTLESILSSSSESTPAPTPTPTPLITPSASRPGIATRLVIPKIDLDRPVLFSPVEGGTWQVEHLEQAVGHLDGTAAPGSDNNMVLAGHVTLAAGVSGPFINLGQLAPGDPLFVYERDKMFLYLVENVQTVHRTNVEVVYPSETGQITLLTCTNWNSEEGRYSDRLVIRGRLIKG